jgi:hypothetical protein
MVHKGAAGVARGCLGNPGIPLGISSGYSQGHRFSRGGIVLGMQDTTTFEWNTHADFGRDRYPAHTDGRSLHIRSRQ